MAQIYDEQYQKEVAALARGMGDALVAGVRDAIGVTPLGARTPTDSELGAFFFQQNALYPPQDFIYPDGHHVFASPWILALEFASNGAEWLARVGKFIERGGA